jgi:preflagellin peptidase FlaK
MANLDLPAINIVRASLALAVMLIASAMDVRTRRVSDWLWAVMGAGGIILLSAQLAITNSPPVYYLILFPVIVIFADVFADREPLYDGKRGKLNLPWAFLFALTGSVLVIMLWKYGNDINFLVPFTVPAMMLVAYFLYYTNLLHGGADAKALLSVSILLPVYPHIGQFPVWDLQRMGDMTTVIIPFGLTMLMNAVLISIIVPVSYAVYNLSRRDIRAPAMFLGYRIELGRIDRRKMWLMEKVGSEKLVIRYMPDRDCGDEPDSAGGTVSDSREDDRDKDDSSDGLENDKSDDCGDEVDDGKRLEKATKRDMDDLDEDELDKLDKEQFDSEIKKLREYGAVKVWVTPKLPFIVFMTTGLVISLLLGNILFGIMSGLFHA